MSRRPPHAPIWPLLAALAVFALSAAPVQAAGSLPDQRGWELVSPLDKNGGAIQGAGQNFGGDVLQAAADGDAVTYSSASSFGEAPAGAPPASQYVSRRGEAGWSTENITAPVLSGSYGDRPDGVPYQLFSPDLARGLLLNGLRCAQGEECPRSYSLWEAGALTGLAETGGLRFEGASPDLRHLVFAAQGGLYEWSGGGLVAVSATPGARLAAQAGAISADGSRVYFTEAGNLYLREGPPGEAGVTCGIPCAGEGTRLLAAGGEFQTATPDGSLAFSTKGSHLYRYDAAIGEATDLTPSGGVQGVLGASESGASVYYQDTGGLWLWREGATTEVAPGAEAASASDYPPTTATARVSADGAHLAFLSKASLTGYDNADQATGQPDSEVYLYEAGSGGGGTLTCASCNPTGKRPLGPSTIPGAIANGTGPTATDSYKPRDLSADGRRLFFDSRDAPVPHDANAAADVYEWEAQAEGTCRAAAGCLALISGGGSAEGASFVDASADGADAFFLSGESLVPSDPGSVDLYDARQGGGFPAAPNPIECEGDSCQPLPSPPEDPTPGTLVPGPANPPVHFPKRVCPRGKRRARHGKAGCGRHHHPRHKRGGRT